MGNDFEKFGKVDPKIKVSKNADKLKQLIEKAIADEVITMAEYDQIINLLTENNIHEKALFSELQNLLNDKTIKFKLK